MGNQREYKSETKNTSFYGLISSLGLFMLLSVVGIGLNKESLSNANLTNQAARNLSSVVMQEDKTLSREKATKFLQSIGYQGKLEENQSIYFRPIVDGFWGGKVEVVIAPEMIPDGGQVREGNLLFDAYTQHPAGKIIASFSRKELETKAYFLK
jgi:hypothetical protein